MMKAAHLKKLEARAERVRQLLLPEQVHRGEVKDPQDRLREIISRVDGGDQRLSRDVVYDIAQFLTVDMAEMIEAVREANREIIQARRDLAMRAGSKYKITIMSDSPLAVESREVADDDE